MDAKALGETKMKQDNLYTEHYNSTLVCFFITIPIVSFNKTTYTSEIKKCKNCKIHNHNSIDLFCSRCGNAFVNEQRLNDIVIPNPDVRGLEDLKHVPLLYDCEEDEDGVNWVLIIESISEPTYNDYRPSYHHKSYDANAIVNKLEVYKIKYSDVLKKYNGELHFGEVKTFEDH